MSFRRDLKLPWWALLGFAALVYVAHSAVRGWDFVPDVTDAFVFGGLVAIVALKPVVARLMKDVDE